MQTCIIDGIGYAVARLVKQWQSHFIREDNHLSNGPRDDDGGVLGVGQETLGSVVDTEEGGPVDDDALDRDAEASVQTQQAVSLEDLPDAVEQALELTVPARFTDVSSQPGDQIERFSEERRCWSWMAMV